MKTVLRATSGILAILSLLLVGIRIYSISNAGMASVTINQLLGLIFPLSVTLLFGYVAIIGRMPFTEEQKTPSSENPGQESR
jgi:hypothetical protein